MISAGGRLSLSCNLVDRPTLSLVETQSKGERPRFWRGLDERVVYWVMRVTMLVPFAIQTHEPSEAIAVGFCSTVKVAKGTPSLGRSLVTRPVPVATQRLAPSKAIGPRLLGPRG